MAGSWSSFLFLVGSFLSARLFLGVAPGLVLAGVESGSGEGVLGVSKGLVVPRYCCLAAMDAGLRERTCLRQLFEQGYSASSPFPLVFTLEVHGSILEGQMK